MSILENQRPALLWKHFEALSAIPRVSQNEIAAGDYVLRIASELKLEAQRDDYGNIVVRKGATPGMEKRRTSILQSHLDMVGQKTSASTHDFAKDPIQLVVEGDWLRAEGTTLGADNGIGVAASLAILESKDIPHGPIAALFTVEEEIGLLGAAQVKPAFVQGDLLINMDGDDPMELVIGCAGAIEARADFPVDRVETPKSWTGLRLCLGGLRGGHSGADIHLGRGNALRLLARLMAEAGASLDWSLVCFNGGSARNAIPREAIADIAVSDSSLAQFRNALKTQLRLIQNEYAIAEPEMNLSVLDIPTPTRSLCRTHCEALLSFLRLCPNGVIRMSDAQSGIVETSSNLAVFSLGNTGSAEVQCLLRSLVDSAKLDTAANIASLIRLTGGSPRIHGEYPGWAPIPNSPLARLFERITREVTGAAPKVAVIHAGLECGIIRAINPALDCISCGARIQGMHSPDERVSISSVATLFTVVTQALSTLPE